MRTALLSFLAAVALTGAASAQDMPAGPRIAQLFHYACIETAPGYKEIGQRLTKLDMIDRGGRMWTTQGNATAVSVSRDGRCLVTGQVNPLGELVTATYSMLTARTQDAAFGTIGDDAAIRFRRGGQNYVALVVQAAPGTGGIMLVRQ